MKNFIYFLVMAFVLVSCGEVINSYVPLPDSESSEDNNADEMEYFIGKVEEPQSRTSLTGMDSQGKHSLKWCAGDMITISDGRNIEIFTTQDNGGAEAEFYHESSRLDQNASQYIAFYPATISSINMVLPAEQKYVKDNIEGFPMVAKSATKTLNFKNICGIIRLRMKTNNDTDIKIASITLSSGNLGMSGPFRLDDYKAVVEEKEHAVTLHCPEHVTISGEQYVDFNIYVPEGKYVPLNITIYDADGAKATFTSNASVDVGRSSITCCTIVFDTKNFTGSLEDLPVVDSGIDFTNVANSAEAGFFNITTDNVDYISR